MQACWQTRAMVHTSGRRRGEKGSSSSSSSSSSKVVGVLDRAGEELVGASTRDTAGSVMSFITSTWQRASLTVRTLQSS
jgi:hypothetical protein